MRDSLTTIEAGPAGPVERPLERLEIDLAGLAASIAAATCQWLLTLAEYDRRQGWQTWECKSCAHWLSWKCAMAMRTAREHVRVARALEHLPLIVEAFGQGRLSYCKVRALTRVANEHNEADLVDLAVAMTGTQLERTVAGLARVSGDERDEEQEAFEAIAARRVSVSDNHDGTHTIALVLPVADAALALEAIDAKLDAIIDDAATNGQTRREVIEHRGGRSAIRADAALELLTEPGEINGSSEPRPFDVTVVIDPRPLGPDRASSAEVDSSAEVGCVAEPSQTGSAEPLGGPQVQLRQDLPLAECRIGSQRIAPTTALRLCCDAIVSTAVDRAELAGLQGMKPDDEAMGTGHNRFAPSSLIDIGRRSRKLPRRLRRALEQRDQNCCQFPGCNATRRLHAHHVIWWRNGGRTALDNLVLLCHFHHRVIHEGRWTVRRSRPMDGFVFCRPDGAPVERHELPPAPFLLDQPPNHHLGSHWSGETLDYSLITSTCLHNETVTRAATTQNAPND